MVFLVKVIGILIIICGITYLIRPRFMRKFMRFWIENSRVYAGALLSIAIGIIFLLAGSRAQVTWFIMLVGLLSIAKGIILFIIGHQRFVTMMNRVISKPNIILRMMALCPIVLGLFILYSI